MSDLNQYSRTCPCSYCREQYAGLDSGKALADELAAALSKVATLIAVDKWQEACLVIEAALAKYEAAKGKN